MKNRENEKKYGLAWRRTRRKGNHPGAENRCPFLHLVSSPTSRSRLNGFRLLLCHSNGLWELWNRVFYFRRGCATTEHHKLCYAEPSLIKPMLVLLVVWWDTIFVILWFLSVVWSSQIWWLDEMQLLLVSSGLLHGKFKCVRMYSMCIRDVQKYT